MHSFLKSATTQPPEWLLPALGFTGAATTAGLLTASKKKGETGRERAIRVIRNALGAGLLGGAAGYGASQAKSRWDQSQDPSTGKNGPGDNGEAGPASSLAARLFYALGVRGGLGGLNRNGIGGLYSSTGLSTPPRAVGAPPPLVPNSLDLQRMKDDLTPAQRAEGARSRIAQLRASVKSSLPGTLGAMGIHGLPTDTPVLEVNNKLRALGIYHENMGMAGNAASRLGHGVENILGSAGRHTPRTGAHLIKRLGHGGVASTALTAAFMAPELVNYFGGKTDDSAGDFAKSYVGDIFYGVGSNEAAPKAPQGLARLLSGYSHDGSTARSAASTVRSWLPWGGGATNKDL